MVLLVCPRALAHIREGKRVAEITKCLHSSWPGTADDIVVRQARRIAVEGEKDGLRGPSLVILRSRKWPFRPGHSSCLCIVGCVQPDVATTCTTFAHEPVVQERGLCQPLPEGIRRIAIAWHYLLRDDTADSLLNSCIRCCPQPY